MSDVTQILNAIEVGDPQAAEKMLPLVYEELRKLARSKMAQESPDHTLQATALVHEAFIRLVGSNNGNEWENRGHFFAAAAEAMRRILVDIARRKANTKNGAKRARVDLDQIVTLDESPNPDLLDVNDALEKLEVEDPDKALLVKLRYFAGLTIDEAAEVMEISRSTAKRRWVYARSWLFGQITEKDSANS